jgi:formylglycine-generating enzyme required for sulfatase activity
VHGRQDLHQLPPQRGLGAAQALYQQLAGAFPSDDLFMDVEGHIKPGDDFVAVLTAQVAACDVLLALIGPRWAELLAARAGDPDDFVVVEIRAALDHGKRVIPVLVGNAAMPRAETLPEPIRALARLQAVSLRPERFAADCQGLVTALDEHFAAEGQARASRLAVERAAAQTEKQRAAEAAALASTEPLRWQPIAAGAGAMALAGFIAYLLWPGAVPRPQEPPKFVVAPPAPKPAPAAKPAPPPKAEPVDVFNSSRATGPLTAAEERALGRDNTYRGSCFRECAVCPEMVVVPAGSFMMGSPPGEEGRHESEGPQHRVTIARPFAVGRFEVTFAEWDACLAKGGCMHRPEELWGRGKQPVMQVSWDDIAQQYLPRLSRKTGKSYRLLTEAEWEYVARAGTTTPFWWGSSISTSQANYHGGPKGEYRQKMLPVDSFAPNPWGFYNVHGNVWEWVQDCWSANYNGAPSDGSAWTTGDCSLRVLRGGSWNYDPGVLRSASRGRFTSGNRLSGIGFRVVRTLTP